MILALLILVPLVGSILCFHGKDRQAPTLAMFTALATLVLGLYAMAAGNIQPLSVPWIPRLGIDFDLALHPSGVAMLVLTPLLTLTGLALLRPDFEERGEFCGYLLLVLASLQGLFVSNNLGLFYIFFELMLLPSLLLAARWGGANGRAAALKFFLYTLVGSLPMLLGVLTLAIQSGGSSLRFDQLANLAPEVQQGLFWLFALAFLVKLPVFPLHGWQVDLYRAVPAPAAAVIAGAMSKAGVYGLLRILVGLFPVALEANAPVLSGLALVSLLYGAVCALGAPCMRSVLAYSSLSHLGLVTLAVAVGGQAGQQGAILQMFSHGIATGGLFLVVGALENRGFNTELRNLSGLAQRLPQLASLTLVLAMASLGCPGLCSFPAELAMLTGVFKSSATLAALASLGVILAGWYGLRFYQGAWNGPAIDIAPEVSDAQPKEWLALVPLVALCFLVGLFPDWTILHWTKVF